MVAGVVMLLVGAAITWNFGSIRDRWLRYPTDKGGSSGDRGAEIGNSMIALLGYAFLVFGGIFALVGLFHAL